MNVDVGVAGVERVDGAARLAVVQRQPVVARGSGSRIAAGVVSSRGMKYDMSSDASTAAAVPTVFPVNVWVSTLFGGVARDADGRRRAGRSDARAMGVEER